ncbi:hypothetical protein Taro_054892 [Colocasia esculenta]|uniref:Uncharacterized protein n=1 Tax=Colocasia esculenta TaxID=4460 RepID=A0A843XSL9_COLES|nr:hypothetical protein [Colocasia esculenta]
MRDLLPRFPVRHPNSSPGARSQAADAIAYGHPFAQTGKTFRSVMEIAYKTPIRNRHSEALDAALLPQAVRRRFGVEKLATPSILRTAGGAHTRSRPVTVIGSRVQLDERSPSQTVDSALVSRNSVLGTKFQPGACVLVHRLPIPPVRRGYLFARGSEPPARPQFRIGTSTRSVNGRIRRFPVRRPNSSPGARSRAADAIAYGHPFAQMAKLFVRLSESLIRPEFGIGTQRRSMPPYCLRQSWIWVPEHRRYSHPLRFIPTPSAKELGITFRTGVGIAYVTTIRNRHSETVDSALVSRNSIPGTKFPPGACVLVHRLPIPPVRRGYLFARGSEPPARPQFRIGTSTRSVNGRIWRFSVRRPNSSPGARSRAADAIAYGHPIAKKGKTFRSVIGIAYKTPIRNRHSEALDAALLPLAVRRRFGVENLRFALRNCDSSRRSHLFQGFLAVATPSISRTAGGAHTRSRPVTAIGSHVRLDARSPPQNFPHGRRNRLCDHNSESALRDGRQRAGFAEFHSVDKIPTWSVCTSTPTADTSGQTRIFIRQGVGSTREAPIQNRHFDPLGKWSHLEIFGPAPKFLSGSAVAGCRSDRIRTPLR